MKSSALKVLFVSDSLVNSKHLWLLSGCASKGHEFFYATAIPDIEEMILGIKEEIDPDIIVISFNIGSMTINGSDFAAYLQECNFDVTLVENTSLEEEGFLRRDVDLPYNVQENTDELASIICIIEELELV